MFSQQQTGQLVNNKLRYLSLFSGVGGFDLGADAAGWECVGQVEWDPWCQKVLNRHWPYVPKWGDVRQMDGSHVRADVIAGGFPCQDVSVAGKRAGMGEGTRSGLYAEIIRIIEEMRRATDNEFPRWVILENVVGLLSVDNGAGFRAVLRDLAEVGALVVEWAMLDSQHFGVPQRRQRIFVVACFDPRTAERCPDPLLPVGQGVRRDLDEGDQARPVVAALTRNGVGGGGGPDDNAAQAGHLVPALTTRCGNTLDDQQTGQLVTAFHMTQEPITSPDVTPRHGVTSGGMGVAYSLSENQRGELRASPTAPALGRGGGKPGQGYPAVLTSRNADDLGAVDRGLVGVTDESSSNVDHEVAERNGKLVAVGIGVDGQREGVAGHAVHHAYSTTEVKGPKLAVRRLTPVECERLQGWPDGHTALTDDDKPIADSHRYRMCGNGITANVAEWVCEQINAAERAA